MPRICGTPSSSTPTNAPEIYLGNDLSYEDKATAPNQALPTLCATSYSGLENCTQTLSQLTKHFSKQEF